MKTIQRRRLLRASGISLALPLLESMSPVFAGHGQLPPKRMVVICTTLGLHTPSLWPKTEGLQYETTEYLSLLNDHRQDFTLFSGLCHLNQSGRRPHDSESTWLTAARNPGFAGFRNSISFDQVAAKQIGQQTRFPSITLGSNSSTSQSYNENGVMLPSRTRPSRLFSDLFLQGTPEQIRKQQLQLQQGVSILDSLGSEIKRVQRQAGSSDIQLLDEYFSAVRAAENNILRTQGWLEKPKPPVDRDRPDDVISKADLAGRVESLFDLIPLILQTDSSRVVTVMIQDHDVVPQIQGVAGNHHNLSHHGQDPQKIEQLQLIESRLIECFGGLLSQLKSTTEAGASVLDRTAVLFGSNMGNANMHNTRNVPVILAGGGFRHRGYVASKDETPLSNLFVTLLQSIGAETETFGQSTGTLSW